MNAEPITFSEDRSIAVPPGAVIKTGYVDVFKCRLACRERMALGDVNGAFQKRLQLGSKQPWPCPRGYWEGDVFVIVDGRHEWVASVMLGLSHILVAWISAESGVDTTGAPCQ